MKNIEKNVCTFVKQNVNKEKRKMKHNQKFTNWLKKNMCALLSVFMLDLTPIEGELKMLYSRSQRGQPPIDPQVILRSLFLMAALGETTSMTRWAEKIAGDPWLARFCGITSKSPAIGTYYHLFNRIENTEFFKPCEHRKRLSDLRKERARNCFRDPVRKPETDQREEEDGVIQTLANRLREWEKQPRLKDLSGILNEILWKVAVATSAQMGFITGIDRMTLAGDGTVLETFATPGGKATCDCRNQGTYRCDHVRQIVDPDAQFGWDNRAKDFIYGYRIFGLTMPACSQEGAKHDFPIYTTIGSANTHEATMALPALEQLRKQCADIHPEARIARTTLMPSMTQMPSTLTT